MQNQSTNLDKAAIVKVTTPEEIYNQLNYMNLDRNIFKSGTPVVEPEMLQMFSEIILCFIHAEGVSMIRSDVSENQYKRYNYYEPHMFLVKVKNSHTIEKTSIYENITIQH